MPCTLFSCMSSSCLKLLLSFELVATASSMCAGALQQRKGAVEDFKAWLHEVSSQWETENLCTAHLGNLLAKDNTGQSIRKRMEAALTLAQPVLLGHELFWGKHEKAKP